MGVVLMLRIDQEPNNGTNLVDLTEKDLDHTIKLSECCGIGGRPAVVRQRGRTHLIQNGPATIVKQMNRLE